MKNEFYPRLNEIVGRRSKYSGANPEKWDPAVKEIQQHVLNMINTSPISFEITEKDNGFTVIGPFKAYMSIEFKPERAARPWPNTVPYSPAHYEIRTSIGGKEFSTAKEMLKFVKSSIELKQLLKGATIEKMRETRIKKILKEPFSKEAVLEYFEFAAPRVTPIKKDTAGPWATSGTSINRYAFDLEPLYTAWPEYPEGQSNEELEDGIERDWKDDICNLRGYTQGGMCSSKVLSYKTDNKYRPTLYIEVETHCYYN